MIKIAPPSSALDAAEEFILYIDRASAGECLRLEDPLLRVWPSSPPESKLVLLGKREELSPDGDSRCGTFWITSMPVGPSGVK